MTNLIERIIRQQFKHFFEKFLWSSAILGTAIAIVQLPAGAQQSPTRPTPLDNIYHETENLPDNADVFPRIGKITGHEQEQTNCRISPWGQIATRFSGNSFIEIDRRQVDSQGESWFHNRDRNCWIHDSRIDLL